MRLQQDLSQCLVEYEPTEAITIEEEVLQFCIRGFSEQAIFNPLEDLSLWFNYSSGQFLAPGYPPLFYNRQERQTVSPSKTAIAGIGEGVAGFLAQRLYRCRKLARPIQDYPDIVMDTPSRVMDAPKRVIYLVESKASTGSLEALKRTIDEEVIRLASYASACLELNTRPIRGLLVATAFLSTSQYQAYITEILL
ncbi:hypothetical protein C7293_24870 [filamentous cyanobacterium CCT1]|nr:hypothetical protein C7293_24870 [filamentous cyanobacterium CCT1]PSN81335.1 hypothetical protein C8B47_01930 [filamentous cyanobacterium CCP4]